MADSIGVDGTQISGAFQRARKVASDVSTDDFRNISVKGLGSAAKSAAKGATADLKDAAAE